MMGQARQGDVGEADLGPRSIGGVERRVAMSLDRWLGRLGLNGPPAGWSGRALLGLRNRPAAIDPRLSVGGRCRMIGAADGWVAVHLARPVDVASVSAVISGEVEAGGESLAAAWASLERWAGPRPAREVVARIRLLDIPASMVPPPGPTSLPGPRRTSGPDLSARLTGVRVVDTTALWAGPLAARLLGDLGAEVRANPSPDRADPTAEHDPKLFDCLHQHHRETAADPATVEGRRILHQELEKADVVLFSARPRALDRLGLAPASVTTTHPHLLMVTVTAYGWSGPERDLAGLGDDVAAAAGAVDYVTSEDVTSEDVASEGDAQQRHPDAAVDGRPLWLPHFVGDALADPVTGSYAALEIARARHHGTVGHLDISMYQATRAALAGEAGPDRSDVAA